MIAFVVIDPGNALTVTQCLFGLGITDEGDNIGTILLGNLLIIKSTLLAADGLALEICPTADHALLGQHIGARRIIVRAGYAYHFAAIGFVGHGGDHQINLALLKKLHTVG